MNRKQKKQIARIVKEVLKKELPKIKKQIMREVKQQQRGQQTLPQQQPQPRQQQSQQRQQTPQQQQQPQRPSQAQPAGQGDGISQFKQIQEQMFEQGVNPAGEGGPTAKPAPGRAQQMSEKEMKQYAERLDPNGASANVQPDPTGGTIKQGQNESRQQFMKRLQQATGGKDPKKVFEESEKSSGSGNWRPGKDRS